MIRLVSLIRGALIAISVGALIYSLLIISGAWKPVFEIRLSEEIDAPPAKVWQVITDTHLYHEWNPFIVGCETTFEVGSPIHMQVQFKPGSQRAQTETVRANREGEYLEYGISAPMGALQSTREHVLIPLPAGGTRYESNFVLSGWLGPIVSFFLGKQLQQGFEGMTKGIANRSVA